MASATAHRSVNLVRRCRVASLVAKAVLQKLGFNSHVSRLMFVSVLPIHPLMRARKLIILLLAPVPRLLQL